MTDHSDALEITYTGVDGRRHRILYKPRSLGGYDRIEQRRDGCGWAPVGREIVSDVEIVPGAEVLP